MILKAENIIKKYGSRTVVKGISLQVEQGQIVGLLGPNGAGKTTSFYMIVGMVQPNDGHIYLDNEEITDAPMYKRAQKGIGYLAQEASVFRKLSVEDNILSVEQAYDKWGSQIAIVGGIDMDFLCRSTPHEIYKRAEKMLDKTTESGGYALGSGNSIPEYVPFENYKAVVILDAIIAHLVTLPYSGA